jgi:hypothetical protein
MEGGHIMTTVQEEARERAAQKLARRLANITSLADPLAWAREFIGEMATPNGNGSWRYIPASPGITPPTPNPDAYERGAAQARDLLNIRKDDHASD